ncbi:MAG: hypothetical protein KGK07_11480 [Chloroflexota bacterium]|nr:hypothetical protein [Chloroflexota bacterium]
MNDRRRKQIGLAAVAGATLLSLAIAFGFPNASFPILGPIFGSASPTATASPPPATSTPVPVATLTPTPTGVPTNTPTPSVTGTPTNTSTPTATPTPLCPGSGTVVCVLPPAQSAFLGQQLTVTVSISRASNLGAYQATVNYDPAVLAFVSMNTFSGVNDRPFLGSSGRPMVCAPQPPSNGQVSVACATLGQVPPPGVNGDGALFAVTFTTLSPGTSPIALTNVRITDPLAVTLPSSTLDGSVTVINATPTPCAGACPTNTPTPTVTPIVTPSGAPVAALVPANASGLVSSTVPVQVTIANAPPLGAFQFSISFAPGGTSVLDVVPGPFLGATGRSVFCAPAYILPNEVTFGCASQGSTIPAPTGSGVLATVDFLVRGVGPTSLTLSVQAADPQGVPISVGAASGVLTGIAGATATPTACPGVCPSATPTATLTPVPTPVSFPLTCAAPGTAVCVQPTAQSVAVGQTVDVGIVAANVTNLGAFQFTVNVDPSVLTPLGADVGAFLGSSGRTLLCPPAVVGTGTLRFSCATLGGTPPAGPNGSGVIASVHFLVAGPGTSAVMLSSVIITDVVGTPLPAVTENASITSIVVTPTPCPGGICPTATSTSTPTPTPTPLPISCPPVAGSAVICLVPATQTVAVGSNFSVDVVVDNATDIGAYEFIISFDAVRLTPLSAVDGGFLGSTGRSIYCPAPIIGPGTIRFACASVGASPPGPTAPGILSIVTFGTNLVGSSTLTFTKTTLSDPLANPIPATGIGGSVTIQ